MSKAVTEELIRKKRCHKCNVVRDITEFYKSKYSKDGYASVCRICRVGHNLGRNIYIKQYDKDEIYKYYVVQQKSTIWIGKKLGVSHKTVAKWLKQMDVYIRSSVESNRIQYAKNAKYDKPFREMVRASYKGNQWKNNILERDNNQCQDCGKQKRLCVHHIKDMYTIIKEFLKRYPQYSIKDDKMLLLELSQSYEPLWEESNGVTLCWDCHCKRHNFDFSSKARPHQNRKNPKIKYTPCDECGMPKRWNGYDKDPVTGKREKVCMECKYGRHGNMKICRCCKIEKHVNEFYYNSIERDRLCRQCKECVLKKSRHNIEKRIFVPNHVCEECNTPFHSYNRSRGQTRFCSKECATKHGNVMLVCKNCNKDFQRNKSAARGYKDTFCCRKCMYEYYKREGKK